MIVLSPWFSGKNNLCLFFLKNPPHELYDYLRDKLSEFITFADPASPPSVNQLRRAPLSSNIPELLSTIFLSHSYFASDKMIRLNSEYVTILKANSKSDLAMVVKDFNIPRVDERSIVHYYNRATERKGQHLLCDSARGELRHNFDRPNRTDELLLISR
ncbi:uncharacterized protein PITG_13218 [Phytophthora infestans T30-4]|uniref:Uncharacterized protein n=1 Tax=Phytophthora infestans (strain T30-4) TaxID=403677 RepID=D0NLG4_PHYIT|nr:uncharacterized protein PITG_13218 [Phytophthora infestans T30-4]EEY60511.1 conserved hypothetical protein [Phytophthora infestans T30-4]|eukprot:XP_002899884.1 conserved hypothetical protein [Phytophthora infestans T30-4]